jgi:hypothetical protein
MADALTTFVSSTLGNQWVSSRQSAPSYGFGTSTREHAAKVFISPKHAELSTMPLSPGPAKYGSKSVLGPQLILTSQPSYGMGTSERFNHLPASQRPNAYDMKDTIGGPGGFSMGTSTRQGVEKVYAVQAGREVRILVRPDQVTDEQARTIAHEVVKRIEEQLAYPGQIRVTVIRETRAVDYAR